MSHHLRRRSLHRPRQVAALAGAVSLTAALAIAGAAGAVANSGPTASPTIAPAPNSNGWNNSAATITWNWSDADGLGSNYITSTPVGTTSGTTFIPAYCVDALGNRTDTGFTVKMDTDTPVSRLFGGAGLGNWTNRDVTFDWSFFDPTSGVDPAACDTSKTVSTEGKTVVNGSCTDLAGNTGTGTTTVWLDKGLPSFQPTLAGTLGSNGYYRSDVTVTWNWSDQLSGTDNCPETSNVTQNGPNQVRSACRDHASNLMVASFILPIDKVPPTLDSSSITQRSVGGGKVEVTAQWRWSDFGSSGIDPAACASTTRATFDVGGTYELSTTCRDRAGNQTSATVNGTVDSTAPVASPQLSPAAIGGWNNTDVTATWNWADETGGSGIDTSACPASTISTGEGTSVSITGTCKDLAGNLGTASATAKIDKTKPTVGFSGNAGVYTVDQSVAITCAASDALSGIASSTCPGASGPAYTFPASNTLSASATDNAGNTGSATATFTVSVTYDSLSVLSARFSSSDDIDRGLADKLAAAKAAAAAGDTKTKNNVLAAYRKLVAAQSGKALTDQQAATLIALSRSL